MPSSSLLQLALFFSTSGFCQASHPCAPPQPHYSNPLVAAKLLNVPKDTQVLIVCKILADHVTFNNPHDPYEGKVEFKLTIQK